MVLYYQLPLARLIHAQMEAHFWQKATAYEARVHQGFDSASRVHYALPKDESVRNFRTAVTERSEIKNMIFGGFEKCLFAQQKFDADPERRFAVILEDDADVQKWVKPARRVFQIDYARGEAYEPDFVVETTGEKLMCEVKRTDQLSHPDVLSKARAGILWCKHASDHEMANAGKPWRYVMIPHDAVVENMTLGGLIARYVRNEL